MNTPDLKLRILRLQHSLGLELPAPASNGSSGLDLRAAIERDLVLVPLARELLPTGISIEVPAGWEGQVRPRSGLAIKHGVTVVNSPGTIDSDYRGEIKVGLINLGDTPFTISRGDRIAQLVIAACASVRIEEVESLAPSARGDGGFGSSGVS